MERIFFQDKEKKIVLFEPQNVDLYKSFFNINPKVILLITFRDKNGLNVKYNNYKVLEEIPFHHLRIIGRPAYDTDLSPFLKISKLKSLDDNYLDLPYDFSNAKNMTELNLLWNKNIKGIEGLVSIEDLSISKYNTKNKRLTAFVGFKELKELRILQSNIENISDISSLNKLKRINLIANKNLSFSNCAFLMPELSSLYLEGSKKVDDNFVSLFPNLERLQIIKCAPLLSLENILKNLSKLKCLNVYENEILEKDNKYWFNYASKMKSFNFKDKNYFTLKRKDFPSQN